MHLDRLSLIYSPCLFSGSRLSLWVLDKIIIKKWLLELLTGQWQVSHNNDDASFPAFKGKHHSFFSEHLNYRLFEIFTFSFQTSQIKDTAGYLLLLMRPVNLTQIFLKLLQRWDFQLMKKLFREGRSSTKDESESWVWRLYNLLKLGFSC